MERVALFGGSFDPFHNGHLYMARKVMESGLVDRMEVMPLKAPYYKKLSASTHQRVKMLRLAIRDERGMSVNLMELHRFGTTYTADTVRILLKKHPDTRYYYVIGDDSMEKLSTWHDAAYLLKAITFIVVYRRTETNDRERVKAQLEAEYGADIILLDTGAYDVSSTEIREAIDKGEDITRLVPERVAVYIKEKKLYGAH